MYSVNFIRDDLGIPDYDLKMSRKARARLHAPANNLDEIIAQNIPTEDLPQVATDVERDVHEVISILLDKESNKDGLPLREVRGLEKAFTTIRFYRTYTIREYNRDKKKTISQERNILDRIL